MEQTQVRTRDNKLEPVSFDKITNRLREICSWTLNCESTNNDLSTEWAKPILTIEPIDISKENLCSYL